MLKIKNIKPLEPHIINPKLSTKLSTLVVNLLAKENQGRPQEFKIVNKRLQRLIDNKQLLSSSREEKKNRAKQVLVKSLFKIKETSFYFAYKYGKMTIAIGVALGVVLSFALSGGHKEVIDKETSAKKVVDYFYKAINHKRINSFKETIKVEKLPHIESMIMHGYIIETAKNLFSNPPKIKEKNLPREKKIVFKIEDLTIRRVDNGAAPEYEADYYFVFEKKDKVVRIKMHDRLILNKNNMHKITLGELFDFIKVQLSMEAYENRLKFTIDDDVCVSVNKFRMSRAIVNLIDNSLKALVASIKARVKKGDFNSLTGQSYFVKIGNSNLG